MIFTQLQCLLTSDVPQGSVLELLLFVIYVDGMNKHCNLNG